MHLILIQPNNGSVLTKNGNLLRLAFSDPTVAPVTLHGLRKNCPFDSGRKSIVLLPNEWRQKIVNLYPQAAYHNGRFQFSSVVMKKNRFGPWVIISNGRYSTSFDRSRIEQLLSGTKTDLAAIYIDSSLANDNERIIYTLSGNVAGFCRSYTDSILPAGPPMNWPHHLFIKRSVFNNVFKDGIMPLEFNDFYTRFTGESLKIRSFKVGGAVQDLQDQNDLLDFISSSLKSMYPKPGLILKNNADKPDMAASARFYGRVLIGDNVQIGENALLVGPAILCSNVSIADKAVIKRSIIGAELSIDKGRFIQNTFIKCNGNHKKSVSQNRPAASQLSPDSFVNDSTHCSGSHFRKWPLVSYPRLIKRLADIIASLSVLILLAPLFPVIAIAIKLTSSGPVFFGHKRQGLHTKEFYCLKFRTMIPGADNIQDKLRSKNQVDGPQFKIEDDPRITAVGRFLRNTYLDEIPQFINVLIGQMSLIGPRPSPQKENSLCPVWHDARLSVRPGITGLWQIKRTRQPGRDFQEWIYYDIEYIRHLSPKMDLQICWDTIKKIASNFFNQF
jgi:lipopolysaccharide/colanic/teichoic acid biosynthesis glycosyltransferase